MIPSTRSGPSCEVDQNKDSYLRSTYNEAQVAQSSSTRFSRHLVDVATGRLRRATRRSSESRQIGSATKALTTRSGSAVRNSSSRRRTSVISTTTKSGVSAQTLRMSPSCAFVLTDFQEFAVYDCRSSLRYLTTVGGRLVYLKYTNTRLLTIASTCSRRMFAPRLFDSSLRRTK